MYNTWYFGLQINNKKNNVRILIIVKVYKRWYTCYGDDMSARRISKASKRRLSVFGTLSLIAIVYFIFSLLYNAYSIYNLTVEKRQLDRKYIELKEEAEELKIDIEKLNDQKYLANYAREKYLYSKDGEYILQIDDDELNRLSNDVKRTNEGIDIINLKLNRTYTLVVLSGIFVIIIIYIIVKGRRKKKK